MRSIAAAFVATVTVFGLSQSVALAVPVPLQQGTATLSQTPGNFNIDLAIDGASPTGNTANPGTGWAIENSPSPAIAQTAAFETITDTAAGPATLLTFTLFSGGYSGGFPVTAHTLGKFRISATTDPRANFADGLNNGGDVTASWTFVTVTSAISDGGITLTPNPGDNYSILASGAQPNLATYTVTGIVPFGGITGFRLEVLEDPTLPQNGPGRRDNGNFVLREFSVDAVATPEPTSGLLLSAGMLVILCRRSRGR